MTILKTTIPLRFSGQYFDSETGLHYNYFRTYNPDLGRYTQPDPIGLEGGWNRFAYVRGNPLNTFDDNGLNPVVGAIIRRYGVPAARAIGSAIGAYCTRNPSVCKAAIDAMVRSLYMDQFGALPDIKPENEMEDCPVMASKGGKQKVDHDQIIDEIRGGLGLDPKDPKKKKEICDFLRDLERKYRRAGDSKMALKTRATSKYLKCDR